MMDRNEIKKLLVIAIYAGKIMLKHGAETYRVEDTITRICKSKSIDFAESFVTPTGIFLSVEYGDEVLTYIKRIKNIKIDLNKIALVNDFSRRFVKNEISIDEAMEYLKAIDDAGNYSRITKLVAGGLAGGFFSIMFGGSYYDLFAAFFISALVVLITEFLGKFSVTYFVTNIAGSSLATLLAIIFSIISIHFSMDKIIIGSIMPLVPGVAITNAVRDSFSGDFLSGVSRGLEAIITALAIAFGVGITLKFYITFIGGMQLGIS